MALECVSQVCDYLFSSTQTCAGVYTPEQRVRGQMCVSIQTYKRLQIAVKSVVQLTRFLLGEGFERVLTKTFCQDDLEEYFGYQRAQGRRSDNPTVANFDYNDLRFPALGDIPQLLKVMWLVVILVREPNGTMSPKSGCSND